MAVTIAISVIEKDRPLLQFISGYWKAYLAWLGLLPFAMYYFDGYSSPRMSNSLSMALSALKAVIANSLLFGSAVFFFSSDQISRAATANIIFFSAAALIPYRAAFSNAISTFIPARKVLILGAGRAGRTIVDALSSRREEYEIVGFLDDNPELKSVEIDGNPILGPVPMAIQTINSSGADLVVMAITHSVGAEVHRTLQKIYRLGIPIVTMAELYEFVTGKVAVDHWGEQWYVNIGYVTWDPVLMAAKRAVDFSVAALMLILSSPLWLLIACAIKITSPGPVFYRQDRVGLNGRVFLIWKFRSMRCDAEKKGEAIWASRNDSRITAIGKVIRKTRLDELPQLINVIKGDMSLIGPRPERPEFVYTFEQDIPFYGMRLSVLPGLTGWAQVMHKYDESIEDVQTKLQYDLFYIKHWSLFLDIRIMIRTIAIVLTGKGAN